MSNESPALCTTCHGNGLVLLRDRGEWLECNDCEDGLEFQRQLQAGIDDLAAGRVHKYEK